MPMTPGTLRFRSAFTQVTWPAPLSPSASSRMAMLYQLEDSQWWSAEALERAQFEQLRHVVAHAVRTVPHYARTLAAFADVADLTPERWTALPLLTRDDLAPGQRTLHSTQPPREHGTVHEDATSGSTGKPIAFLATDLTAFFWRAFALREHFWHRREFGRKLMSIRYVKDKPEQATHGLRSANWGAATDEVVRTGEAVMYDIRNDIAYLAERLRAERPGYLLGHASVLAGLVDDAERHGWRPEGLLELRSLGEMVPDDLRERALRLWGVPLVDMYTCQEAGYLAAQCPDHPEHLHVQSENVLLEVVDADGRPCRAGEVGRVLITSLNNFACPLIRYELGDYARLGAKCPCGRGLPVLERVMGRYRNLVTLPNGDRRWPRIGYESLREVAPVDQIQLIQHTLEDIEARLVMREPLTEAHVQALTAFIQRNLGHAFRVRCERVASIVHPVNGKVEAFISKLPPAATQPRG